MASVEVGNQSSFNESTLKVIYKNHGKIDFFKVWNTFQKQIEILKTKEAK